MQQFLFGKYSWPFVALGGLLAAACVASIWYINRLQSDLTRAVRHDAARMESADELQVQLRHLRFHTVVFAADPTEARREVVRADTRRVQAALDEIRRDAAPEDTDLVNAIERDYEVYESRLGPDGFPIPVNSLNELVKWSDAHPMRELLEPCRQLSERHNLQMHAGLARSEAQTTWAGRVLLGLGLVGALGGLLAGYATARGMSRRATQLSVRVQAVQAQLDQEVGAMTVAAPRVYGDLEAQLDRVVGRVREVCRRLQEQERDLLRAEQLAAVGHLATGVAHEVRNPLTGIKFLIEAALRPSNPTQLSVEDLRLIRQEISRMERTVQELLDYARTPPPDRHLHDLRGLVSEAAVMARSRAERKSVSIDVQLPPDALPASVDHHQLLSLLTNLLFNAIDAAPVESTVVIRVFRAPEDQWAIEVADTGPGIDPAVAERLFTPFATTKPTGTGLGLTVARRIARDHGGTITATDRPGGGARFTLTLPARVDYDAEAATRG